MVTFYRNKGLLHKISLTFHWHFSSPGIGEQFLVISLAFSGGEKYPIARRELIFIKIGYRSKKTSSRICKIITIGDDLTWIRLRASSKKEFMLASICNNTILFVEYNEFYILFSFNGNLFETVGWRIPLQIRIASCEHFARHQIRTVFCLVCLKMIFSQWPNGQGHNEASDKKFDFYRTKLRHSFRKFGQFPACKSTSILHQFSSVSLEHFPQHYTNVKKIEAKIARRDILAEGAVEHCICYHSRIFETLEGVSFKREHGMARTDSVLSSLADFI